MYAKEAKELAKDSRNADVTQILRKIRNVASMGLLKLHNVYLHPSQTIVLKSLGYKVELSPDVMEDYEISWE